MGFDVRMPVGLLFIAIGALVVFAGLTAGPSSPGAWLNIDQVWGLAMIAFGAAMLILCVTARKGRD